MIINLMKKKVATFILHGVLCMMLYVADGVSVSCMMEYEEGGAPTVFGSPECPHWVYFSESSPNSTTNCQFATLKGHRDYQEDRVTCNLELKLPFSVEGGPEEITIGIAAVFDGHGGDEASEMASKRLLSYFVIHVVITAYKRVLPSSKHHLGFHTGKSSQITAPTVDNSTLAQILEEALLMTIHDIDSEFSKEAWNNGYISGSTATIVLLNNDQFLVASVGDSKALLCSQKVASSNDAEGSSSTQYYAEELTRDHHPDRKDEKARIKAAGGFVSKGIIPRVNGILAVSRAIGDVYLKRYGVTAKPEISGWRHFGRENKYLVVASDGIFETVTPQNVCELLLQDKTSPKSSSSLAGSIVGRALKTGSTDNLSAIVISNLNRRLM